MTKDTAAVAAVDLSAFMSSDVGVLDVVHPVTGAPIGWKITFAGPGHPKTEALSNEKAREGLRRARQVEMTRANGRKFKPEEQSVEDLQRENVHWVVARIVDWTPVKLGREADVITFSEKAAMDLFMKPELGWAYAQALDFLAAEASFMTASAKS